MEIFIALDLPKEIDKLVDEKRAIFYPQIIGRLEPHITITEPAKITSSIAVITHKLTEITQKTKPIEIIIDGLGHFGKKVIFWKILSNPSLIKLNQTASETLRSGLFYKNKKNKRHSFSPHITILSRATRQQFNEVMAALRRENYRPRHRFFCDTLMIMENLPNQPGWKKSWFSKLSGMSDSTIAKLGG